MNFHGGIMPMSLGSVAAAQNSYKPTSYKPQAAPSSSLPVINLRFIEEYIKTHIETQKRYRKYDADLLVRSNFYEKALSGIGKTVRGILIIEDDEGIISCLRREIEMSETNWKKQVIDVKKIQGSAINHFEDAIPILIAQEANEYEKAVELVVNNQRLINMVITDLRLEGYSGGGRKITRELREAGYDKWIFFFSGSPDERKVEYVDVFLEGADAYIDKTFFLGYNFFEKILV